MPQTTSPFILDPVSCMLLAMPLKACTHTSSTYGTYRKSLKTMSSSEEKIQQVAFIRHGVARHNLYDPVTRQPPNLEDPNLWDPPLVYQGKKQALEAGEQLKTWWRTTKLGEEIELIVTSPLTRCIQTTMLGFLPGDMYADNNSRESEPQIYCTELVREAFGMHYPDKRREKSLLQKHWPYLMFDDSMTENDDAWSPDRRETIHDIRHRISLFLETLSQREETNVVVVSHGVWIERCFHMCCPEALEHGKKRVHNCNVFVGECVSREGKFLRLQNVNHIH